jgi:DNA (cytosine-5)-methyltransferase 1
VRTIPVIDVFAGPGGLGEGFASFGRSDGKQRFSIRLSIEKDCFAHQTLLLRSFFRQFATDSVPDDYYRLLRGKINLDGLSSRFPEEAANAQAEAWNATLGETPWNEVTDRIASALRGAEIWTLIGGPPCQAYSVAGRSRSRGKKSYVPERDERHYLYREYLKVIADQWPAVFVMENVKGLLSSTLNGDRIFHRILRDLEDPSNALGGSQPGRHRRVQKYRLWSLVERGMFEDLRPRQYIVKTERLGIPQARHRVIILGIRDDLGVAPHLVAESEPVPASRVLSGLPELRSGLSEAADSAEAWRLRLLEAMGCRWIAGARRIGGDRVYALLLETLKHLKEPAYGRGGEFVECEPSVDYAPEWFLDRRLGGVCNHRTRLHIGKDLHRYLYAACYAKIHGASPTLAEFPRDLLPEHKNVEKALEGGGLFDDRFRVQLSDRPATTVTSHISKDDHHYIHPDPLQCRSLTVREALRPQTSPGDNLFVSGRAAQFKQRGSSVPPWRRKRRFRADARVVPARRVSFATC